MTLARYGVVRRIIASIRWAAPLILAQLIASSPAPATEPAGPVVLLSDSPRSHFPLPGFEYLEDPQGTLDFRQVMAPANAARFRARASSIINFGYTRSAYWVRFRIKNESRASEDWILAMKRTDLLEADLYLRAGTGEVVSQRSGNRVPMPEREEQSRIPAFHVRLPPGETVEALLRLVSNQPVVMQPKVFSRDRWMEYRQKADFWVAAHHGLIIALFLYNLLFAFSFRERIYLHYLVWQGLCVFTFVLANGYQIVVAGDIARDWGLLLPVSRNLVVLSSVFFSRAFLRTRSLLPAWDRWFWALAALNAGLAATAWIPAFLPTHQRLTDVAILMAVALFSSAGFAAWRRGLEPAKFYLASWLGLFLAATIYVLNVLGVIERNAFTENSFLVGTALEMLLAALAIASLMNNRLELRLAEQGRALKDANVVILEHRASLEASARLTALGEMAGGIAHEINTPLQVILMNGNLLRRCMERGDVEAQVIGRAITAIEQTVNRIAEIIRGIRAFARDTGHLPFERAPIAKILDDSLAFCSSKFRAYGIQIETEVAPSDLEAWCRPVQVTQVLVNLLNNSFDALDGISGTKWIRIEAFAEPGAVRVRVIDNGAGIPPEAASKIMQPFFTTKTLGKGTGLGLSVSKGIIEAHGGAFTLNPREAHTCFEFTLRREAARD